MTPKEKAEDIVRKYSTYVVMWAGGVETGRQNVKQCALIAVDEILSLFINECEDTSYWQEVKNELEKL